MRSRSRQSHWLQKVLYFVFAAGVVTAAGASGDWSNVRSITFTSNAAEPKGVPPDGIHASSFEAGEMPGPVFCNGAFGDRDGDGLRDLACVTEFVPADPATVAPPLDPTVPANYYDATTFIYEGVDPIQRGVRPGTIADYRAAVMRGLVKDDQGQPLAGVLVRVLDRPEFGYTYTRSDGMFDMVVNGGGDVVVHYTKNGYLRAQRRIDTPWNDWRWVDDATMIPVDPAMTVVPTTGAQGPAVARASTVTDADGSRRATAFFSAGTQAWLKFANGSTQPAPQLSFRATEYTVGADGLDRMPGVLPPTTAYTYAIELSADEAVAAGAQSVEFSQPVAMYLENFRQAPVGSTIPVGSYSFRQASWNPEDDGRVIKILSTSGGIATIDIDGSGNAAGEADLLELGITISERTALASTYVAGTELWRYRASHFTPWDCNLPLLPDPDDAIPPEQRENDPNDPDPEGDPNSNIPCTGGLECTENPNHPEDDDDEEEDDPCVKGSAIFCNSRALGETLSVPGTGLSLNYHSKRVPARTEGNVAVVNARVRITGESLPPRLQEARIRAWNLGTRQELVFKNPTPNQIVNLRFEYKDAYSRTWLGSMQPAIELAYRYPARYSEPANDADRRRSWERFGQPMVLLSPAGDNGGYEVRRYWAPSSRVLGDTSRLLPGFWDARGQGFGGWTLGNHHVFDLASGRLFAGTGKRMRANSAGSHVPQVSSLLLKQIGPAAIPSGRRIAAAPDGSVFMLANLLGTDGSPVGDGLIRFRADGTREDWGDLCAIPDTDCVGSEGEYVPMARDLAVDANGHVFVTDGVRIFRFKSPQAPEVFVSQSGFPQPCDVRRLLSRQQRLYFSCAVIFSPGRIDPVSKRGGDDGWVGVLWPNGATALIAGGGSTAEDGVAAEALQLLQPTELAMDFDGNLFVFDEGRRVLWRVRSNGAVESVIGDGTSAFTPDGSVAKGSPVGSIAALASTTDDRIVFAEVSTGRLREIRSDGLVHTRAGGGDQGVGTLTNTGSIARQLSLYTQDIDILPEGSLAYLAASQSGTSDSYLGAVINSTFASYRGYGGDPDRYEIASRGGDEIYVFDRRGRHLESLHGLTGSVIERFLYNPSGYLVAVEDGDGDRSRIERDAGNKPTAIVSQDDVRTELVVSDAGYLTSLATPTRDRWRMDYFPDGLMRTMDDPRDGRSQFFWAPDGGLSRNVNAVGGFVQLDLSRYDSVGVKIVQTETAEVRTSQYFRNRFRQNGSSRVTARSSGIRSGFGADQAGVEISDHRHGVSVRTIKGADPRFGAGSPISKRVVTTLPEDGIVHTRSFERVATPTVPDGPPGTLNLTDTTTVNGRVHIRGFDAPTRTWTLSSPMGRTTTIEIDGQGRPLSIAVPDLAPVQYTYDARGRLERTEAGSGLQARVTEFGYDTRGYFSRMRDAALRELTLVKDASGRTTTQRLPDLREIGFRYDVASNVVGITPPGRDEHGFAYNAVQRLTNYTPPALPSPGTVATGYGYNLDRQLTSVARPDGDSIALTYASSSGLPSSLEGELNSTHLTTDGYGRITSIIGGSAWPTSLAWNGVLPKLQSATIGSDLDSPVRHVRWGYDNNFWLRSIEVADSAVGGTVASTAYQYDNDGLLTRAATGDAVMLVGRRVSNGLLTGTNLGVVSDAWTYNPFAEPVGYAATVSSVSYYSTGFLRDRLGRVLRKTEVIDNATNVFDYSYDLAGRLDTVRRDGALIADYGFDANSNPTSVAYAAPLTGQAAQCAPAAVSGTVTIAGVVDAQDRLTSFGTCTFAYRRNGELTTKIDTATSATTTYVYDEFGNLRTVDLPDGREIEYMADGLNRRVGKKIGGTLVQAFLYVNQTEPIAELDGNGNVIATFVYADRLHVPAYMLKGGRVFRILSDHLGSVRLVVDTQDGTIAQRIDYDAFGNVLSDTAPGFQPFGFAGGIYDRDTGLTRFGARDYDPVIGRWTAKDPSGFNGSDTNFYRYAHADPINHIDTSGTIVFVPYLLGIAGSMAIDWLIDTYLAPQVRDWLRDTYGCDSDEDVRNFLDNLATAADIVDAIRALKNPAKLKDVLSRMADNGKRFDPNQEALVDLAKQAKRDGASREQAEIMRQWADEYDVRFRGVESHPGRPQGQFPHIHVGPVNHIPVR